jgi:hypothetical protein
MARHPLSGEPGTGQMGTLYLIHFERPFGHARHYTGWCLDLAARFAEHQAGCGARLIRHVVAAGIGIELAWSGPGDRHMERQLKNGGHAADRCPVCITERGARSHKRKAEN